MKAASAGNIPIVEQTSISHAEIKILPAWKVVSAGDPSELDDKERLSSREWWIGLVSAKTNA